MNSKVKKKLDIGISAFIALLIFATLFFIFDCLSKFDEKNSQLKNDRYLQITVGIAAIDNVALATIIMFNMLALDDPEQVKIETVKLTNLENSNIENFSRLGQRYLTDEDRVHYKKIIGTHAMYAAMQVSFLRLIMLNKKEDATKFWMSNVIDNQKIYINDIKNLVRFDGILTNYVNYQQGDYLRGSDLMAALMVLVILLMWHLSHLVVRKKYEVQEVNSPPFFFNEISDMINSPIFFDRAKAHAKLQNIRIFIEDEKKHLEAEVMSRIEEVHKVKILMIQSMNLIAKKRDDETGRHICRTQQYVRLLAQQLKKYPKYAAFFSDGVIELLYQSAALHDLGKIGIPDAILHKDGPLTPEEFKIMKTHALIGGDILLEIERKAGQDRAFLRFSREIAYSHHEKWDGTGYPCGFIADEIPISARLMAVADVYDALVSRRIYKPRMCHQQAAEFIRKGTGTHFDPDVVNAFFQIEHEIEEIAELLVDTVEYSETINSGNNKRI